MDVCVSGGTRAPSLAARATCYTVASCYSRLPGYTVGTDLTQESMPQTATPPIVDRSRFFALIILVLRTHILVLALTAAHTSPRLMVEVLELRYDY